MTFLAIQQGCTLLAPLLLGPSIPGPGDDPPPPPAVEEESVSAVLVDLHELRSDPCRWLGERVRFVLQFNEAITTWEPYFSRFGRKSWVAFSGWSDQRFVWDPRAIEDPMTRFFVKRGHAPEAAVARAGTYQRFEVIASVREIFLGEPWLEVHELTPLPEHVGEGTIIHVGRAREFMRQRQWKFALQQLERAKAAPLPAHVLSELERKMIECQLQREADGKRVGLRR